MVTPAATSAIVGENLLKVYLWPDNMDGESFTLTKFLIGTPVDLFKVRKLQTSVDLIAPIDNEYGNFE